MKHMLISGLIALTLAPAVFGDTADTYENWGAIECPPDTPPMIDASNFVNHSRFVINFTNIGRELPITASPYETSSTLNFANNFGALMSCNTGFRLDTNPSDTNSLRRRASSLYNNGTIACGTLGTSNVIIIGGLLYEFIGTGAGAKCLVDATNIVNPGTISMGFKSLLTLKGERIDLNHGTLEMETSGFIGANSENFFRVGFVDGYWGLGDSDTQPLWSYSIYDSNMIPVLAYYGTQTHVVTNRSYVAFGQELAGTNFVSYLLDVTNLSTSNRTVRAVFLSNTNPLITTKVYFETNLFSVMAPTVVELSSVFASAQGSMTNFLYISDSFLTYTNFQLRTNGYAGAGFNRPTCMPVNYTIARNRPFFGDRPPAPPTAIPRDTFDGPFTNQWSAYEAVFLPNSALTSDVAGQNVTNMAGRIELTADKHLALPDARINSESYLLLRATNHFGGSSGAEIASPFADLYLRSTNGLLNLTNVLEPVLPRPVGICDLYSARWTNIVADITNRFHVLFVDLRLAPIVPLMVQTLNLVVTNAVTHTGDDSLYIRDVFNVTSNLFISTRRLTLTTNAPDSRTPAGILDYLNPSILWPVATPRLAYLTNHGGIQAQDLMVFGGSQTSPYSSADTSTNPYAAFVNSGGVTNYGSSIFASYFQNSGRFLATDGAIQLRQAQTAILTNGAFLAGGSAGTILIQSDSLLVSNHVLHAGNTLTLSVANYLDDGSLDTSVDFVTNKNIWNAGNGFNLPLLPHRASLLATTVTNTSVFRQQVPNVWAGTNRGCSPDGFVTNAGLGRLILDGGPSSTFMFKRTGPTNALYVDYLEFRNFMTNQDNTVPAWLGIRLETNFTIYYAQAVLNGRSIAERLDGQFGADYTNGGHFRWVSNYHTGFFSSTNVVYRDGTSHRFNTALVTSCSIDSDGDGIPNCWEQDPIPVATPVNMALSARLTNGTIILSWNTIPLSSNYLYVASKLPATNWQLVTQFLSDNTLNARVMLAEPVLNRARFYRARVDSP